MPQPAQPDGVPERLDDGFLADDLAERLRPESPVDRLVGRGFGERLGLDRSLDGRLPCRVDRV